MLLRRNILSYLCLSLSGFATQVAIAEPRNCYVEGGEIICQTNKVPTAAERFQALDPSKKGQVVYREQGKRNGATMGFGGTGYIDGQSTLTATITKNNKTFQREIKMLFLERENETDKRIIVIHKPKDIKGTALLTISNKNGLDDQWLYSPDNKQVSRIPRNNSGSAFAGTDVFFEDLSLQSLSKYDFQYLRKEIIMEREVHVIARFPKDQYSAYKKLVTWVDVEHFYPVKVDYFDKKNTLMKTLIADGYKQYNEKFWRAGTMTITNHQNQNKTQLVWSNYQFNIGLSEQLFSLNGLKRAQSL